MELVRYIHLNPLRAGIVKNMEELDCYPWSGHGVLIGRAKNDWQERDYVLSQFSETRGKAARAYRRFVEEGVALGRRDDLVGGGLVRSLGGWSQVLSMRGERKKVGMVMPHLRMGVEALAGLNWSTISAFSSGERWKR